VQVPAGEVFGAPFGISFFGTAFSEPKLIELASGYEAFTQARAHNLPTFAPNVPSDHIAGTTLKPPHDRGAHTGSVAAPPSSAAPKPGQSPTLPKDLAHRRPRHI
jgi:amidase